jgi:hypothetical protein
MNERTSLDGGSALMTETPRGMHDVERRVRGEFLEMPGLRLTPEQARRLWRLDQSACEAVLGALVKERFLAKTRDGAFIRDDGHSSE